jgi:hypothetical protein
MNDSVNSARNYLHDFLSHIVNGLPKFLGALLILIIGYFVARAVASLVARLLERARLDKHLHAGHGGNVIQRAVPSPTNLLAKVTYWIVFLFSISIAVSVLGIPVLVDLVRAVYAYIPNIIAAILIFLVASAVSAGVVKLIGNTMGDTPTGKVLSTATPILVMGLAIFMILNELRIAPEIVNITYAAMMGSAALGLALAFGLGGRDVAARILEGLYAAGQRNKADMTAHVRRGATRASRKANDLRGRY